jgi:hypothetical protein
MIHSEINLYDKNISLISNCLYIRQNICEVTESSDALWIIFCPQWGFSGFFTFMCAWRRNSASPYNATWYIEAVQSREVKWLLNSLNAKSLRKRQEILHKEHEPLVQSISVCVIWNEPMTKWILALSKKCCLYDQLGLSHHKDWQSLKKAGILKTANWLSLPEDADRTVWFWVIQMLRKNTSTQAGNKI